MSNYNVTEPPLNGNLANVKAYLMEQYNQLGAIIQSIDEDNFTDGFISRINAMEIEIANLKAEIQTLKGNNGDVYCVTTTKNGYKIVDETKDEAFNLNFDENTQTWSAEINGSSYKLATMNEDGTITMNLRNGETLTVNPDMQGIDMARNAVENRAYISDFAMN